MYRYRSGASSIAISALAGLLDGRPSRHSTPSARAGWVFWGRAARQLGLQGAPRRAFAAGGHADWLSSIFALVAARGGGRRPAPPQLFAAVMIRSRETALHLTRRQAIPSPV